MTQRGHKDSQQVRTTPREFMDWLNVQFDWDAAASAENSQAVEGNGKNWWDEGDDALSQDWTLLARHGGIKVWCNPPYANVRGGIMSWVKKAIEAAESGADVYMLLPNSTDAKWFELAYNWGARITLLTPRLQFDDGGSNTLGSVLVRFRRTSAGDPGGIGLRRWKE